MKIFFGILLYFLIGTIVAGVRLFIYNVDLTEFTDFTNTDCDDANHSRMAIIFVAKVCFDYSKSCCVYHSEICERSHK